jgi:5-methylcytosine-specific restriction enzyme subunit McrC
VEQHTDGPRFGLRPDVLLRKEGRTRVFDMKWKTISPDDPTGNYGLEQADLYQHYAYGQKYEADEVVLVFPAHETFREPLPAFRYDARTRLYVVPFDLTRPLAEEVEKLVTRPLPT